MRKEIIKYILFKELRDIFRDKKTVFMMILLPILLYPVLLIGFSQVTMISSEAMQKKELVISFDFIPDSKLLALIDEANNDKEGKLIITDKDNLEEALSKDEIAAYVKQEKVEDKYYYKIYMNASSDDSNLATQRIEAIFSKYKESIIKSKIEEQGLSIEDILEPIEYESINTAKNEEMTGYLLGQILPVILIIGILLGAIYPAIDVMAGEKERGTLETLLTFPVSNLELIIGKYLAVAAVAVISALLNILSIVMSLVFMLLQLGTKMGEQFKMDIHFSDVVVPFVMTLICIILFALVITAVIMCVCSLAKSFKEAQNYSTPIMLVFMLPAYVCMLPNIEFNNITAAIPVVNIALLIKNVFLFKFDALAILIVMLSSLAFAILSLMVLTKMFNSEAILFGEGKSFSFLEKRHNIKKNTMPGVSDAVVLYAIAILLLVYVGSLMQLKWGVMGIALTEIMFLVLTIGLAYYIKTDFMQLFSIKKPQLKGILGGVILWAGAFAVTLVIVQFIVFLFPSSIETLEKLDTSMFQIDNLWINLMVIAFLPAVCEETLYRGFIFGSLRRKDNNLWPMIITSLMFSIMHLYPIKIIPTAILGMVLVYALYKTQSIFVSMLIHFINNGIVVILSHFELDNIMNNADPTALFDFNYIKTLLFLSLTGLVLIMLGIKLLEDKSKLRQKNITNT